MYKPKPANPSVPVTIKAKSVRWRRWIADGAGFLGGFEPNDAEDAGEVAEEDAVDVEADGEAEIVDVEAEEGGAACIVLLVPLPLDEGEVEYRCLWRQQR